MTTPSNDLVYDCLEKFRLLVNANQRARKLLKGWEPVLLIEPSDGDERYYLRVRNAEVTDLTRDCEEEIEHLIHIRGPKQELTDVFGGTKNAARAVLDATLEVFAPDRDQVKLDALSMVLWGV